MKRTAIRRRVALPRAPIDPRLVFDRSRYSAAYLAEGYTEAQVQRVILDNLARVGIAAWAFDAGGKAMRARAGAGGAGAGAAGLPDIVGILPGGRALFIEVKRPGRFAKKYGTGPVIQFKRPGEVTEAQAAFLLLAIEKGAAAGVAWSIVDALEIAGIK